MGPPLGRQLLLSKNPGTLNLSALSSSLRKEAGRGQCSHLLDWSGCDFEAAVKSELSSDVLNVPPLHVTLLF